MEKSSSKSRTRSSRSRLLLLVSFDSYSWSSARERARQLCNFATVEVVALERLPRDASSRRLGHSTVVSRETEIEIDDEIKEFS